jgi:hypothetical protein
MTGCISRRTVLRGAGAAVALPMLESVGASASSAGSAGAAKPPVRAAFYIVGGGAYVPYWAIDDAGRKAELSPERSVVYQDVPKERNEPLGALSPTLEPLEPHKKDLLVLGGLTLVDTHMFEDGHSAEIAGLLTGAALNRERVFCGTSVDQVAARRFDGKTYLDSLVLGLNGARPGGAKGIGRVYAQHYSWRTPTTPAGEERNPRAVFDRLFRGRNGAAGAEVRKTALSHSDRRSVLDLVREEAGRLAADVSAADRHKLDEYLSAVRDVEKRIDFAAKNPPAPDAPALAGDPNGETIAARVPAGAGIPESYVDYDRLMIDLIALAFQSDRTRVAVLTHGGYRSYPEVGVKRGHHDLQHHEGSPEKRADLRKVDRFNMGLFAYMLERFKAIKEPGGGTLLDSSMVMWGSGMSNGNRHARENLPILLAGRAGGTLKPGRYLDYNWRKHTPLSNLYVEMLARLGVAVAKFGDSTGGLTGLNG